MIGAVLTLDSEAAQTTTLDFVFAAYHTYVYKLAYTLLGNTHDAEDVSQEVFLSVCKALPAYDPERGAMRTWLNTITVNACKRHRRRNFLHYLWKSPPTQEGEDSILEPADPSLLGAPEDQALQSELRKIVKAVLAKLGPEHRTVLVLHYYLDLSCSEIAAILGCPEGTVYSRLHHARRLVRSQIPPEA